LKLSAKELPESAEMLADSRFLMAVVAVRKGEPIFQWQDMRVGRERKTRAQALENWIIHARPILEKLLAGCGFECLLPDAYHINLRESDRLVRPYAIRAAVAHLQFAVNAHESEVKASIAGFGVEQVDEYRIGLWVGQTEAVYQGVVWPLFGGESAEVDGEPLQQIRATLKEIGVSDIRLWPELIEPDFCEDCGAPLYPNHVGELVHIEAPEEAQEGQAHFH
jgi:hypothetical protein